MTIEKKLRERLFEIKKNEKLSNSELAKLFGISERVIYKWTHRIEPIKKRKKPETKINMKELEADVKENPDAYLVERAEKFKVSISCIFYALKRLNISYKKR